MECENLRPEQYHKCLHLVCWYFRNGIIAFAMGSSAMSSQGYKVQGNQLHVSL